MATLEHESLADKINRTTKEAKESALRAIGGLQSAATQLEMADAAEQLRSILQDLESDTFKILVMGRFKNGKSTLLNALLGGTTKPIGLAGLRGPMVVDPLPATAVLTSVRYSDEPWVKAYDFTDKAESWTFERYLQDSIQDIDRSRTEEKFRNVKAFDMGFPARLCQAGVEVCDSPGLDDDNKARTPITKNASKHCDMAIVVYRSDALMSESERKDANEAVADGTKIFTVVNLWSNITVNDRLRGYVWDRMFGDTKPGFTGKENLGDHDIYFVDAQQACDARYSNDKDGVVKSGLIAFEDRLFDFLAHDRAHIHVSKFARLASLSGDAIEQHLGQRIRAAETDKNSLRTAYEQVKPQLAALRSRPERLTRILAKFRQDGTDALIAGFQQAVDAIGRELPDHLAATPLMNQKGMFDVLRQRRLADEAAEILNSFIQRRLDEWGDQRAPAVLAPFLERMGLELEREITTIEHDLGAIHQHLTGWQFEATGRSAVIVPMKERILSSVAGLLLGDISAAFTGGAAGWRGAAGGITGALGSAVLLTIIGATASAVFFPITIVAGAIGGLVFGSRGFADRAKQAVVVAYRPKLAELADKGSPVIAERVSSVFDAIQDAITARATATIREEERHIEQMVQENQRNQADRDRTLKELNRVAKEVTTHRAVLREALVQAQQG